MTSKSRRAFLRGRAPAPTAWGRFLARVQEEYPRQVQSLPASPQGAEQALFIPAHVSDVHAVFLLAQHFAIQLSLFSVTASELDKGAQPDTDIEQPVLWLDPRLLQRCERIDDQGRFYIEPGATMQQLVAAGLTQFAALPGQMTFIQWLSDPAFHQYRDLASTGVQMASMVMADCSVARLGPFGAHSNMELNTSTLQRVVPQLFQLLETPVAQQCLQLPTWPARFRLDALAVPEKVNLAYLVLGQSMQLGWVEWVVLDAQTCTQPAFRQLPTLGPQQRIWVQELDAAVQQHFDPRARFLNLL